MDRGTYIAASGGLLQFRKLEVMNNNLANVNTPGFKKEMLRSSEQSFDQTLAAAVAKGDPYARPDHDRTPGTVSIESITDFSPGPIKNTGNPLDVALRNPHDFFVVQTAAGTEYTRAGNFTLDENGQIVTQDGFPVQGDGGAISVTGPGAKIGTNGAVQANGQNFGALQVVRIDDPSSLERTGGTRFKLKAGQAGGAAVEPDLTTSSLEMPNISVISNVVELITTNRAFDMYTKSAQAIDTLNQTAISQVGRPRG